MRPKSGLPKRKALRAMPRVREGFRSNEATTSYLHPQLSGGRLPGASIGAVSLFAGCGGLDLGVLGGFQYRSELYEPLPFHIVAAYDNDPKAIRTYRLNLLEDVHEVDLTVVDSLSLPSAELLLGEFPCQDFSSSGQKLGLDGTRGRLYRVMVEYMKAHQPEVVVAENVPHLARMRRGAILGEIISELEDARYSFQIWNLYCPDYGLPQNRHRLFLVGVRNDLPGSPRKPQATFVGIHRSIDWAIDDLVDVTDEAIPNQSQYFVATRATAGAGQGDQNSVRGEVAYCVRANSKARVHFHYGLDRRLTVRECARLQSFPDEFVFPHAAGPNMIHIGNAVPPIIGHQVARSIASYFDQLRSGSPSDAERANRFPVQLSLPAAD